MAGFVWFQGWNEMFNDTPYTADQLKAEYGQNLVDLVHDLRAADPRIPGKLGAMIPESADQNDALNAGRIAAVAALNAENPGSAVYFTADGMIGGNWGNNPDGAPFTTGYGYHFNSKAENYLEVGWRMGQTAIDKGFTGSEAVPEPGTWALLISGLLCLLPLARRLRQAR